MLHIAKLAVGVRTIEHLRLIQAQRGALPQTLRHRTRNMPRRGDEIVGSGSLYWVIAGAMLVRQPIIGIEEDRWEDGSRCAALLLDPGLVQVEGRPTKAFQGWRYLEQAAAPADLDARDLAPDAMPPALRNELKALCLI